MVAHSTLRLFRDMILFGGAFLLGSASMNGQSTNGNAFPRVPADVLNAARKTYLKSQTEHTAKSFRKAVSSGKGGAWFNGYSGRIIDEMFTEYDGQYKRKKGELWSVSDVAEPGDVIRVYEPSFGGKDRLLLVLVYVGEESFPDVSNREFSFFIYPYRTKLEYNTFPPRMHTQYVEARIKQGATGNTKFELPNVQDSERSVNWLRPGATKRSVFLKSNLINKSPGLFFKVYRAGQRKGFDDEQLAILENARMDAIALSRLCARELRQPSPLGRKLLRQAFGVTKLASSDARIASIRKAFETNAVRLRTSRFQAAPQGTLTNPGPGIDIPAPHAETDSSKSIIRIPSKFFAAGYKEFMAVDDDQPLYQTSIILHEGMHLVTPVSEANYSVSYGGHWGGLVNYKFTNNYADGLKSWEKKPKYKDSDPTQETLEHFKDLKLAYEDAVRNPYAYQYFAIWLRTGDPNLSKLLAAQRAKDVFTFLRNDFDYRTVLKGDPIDFDNDEQIQFGCQYRASAMCEAMKRQYPSVPCKKIFSIASGFPHNRTITPKRGQETIKDLASGGTLKWAFHVAPLVTLEGKEFVIDPSLFNIPVMPSTWLKAQSDGMGSLRKYIKTPEIYHPSGGTPEKPNWAKGFSMPEGIPVLQ